MNRIFFDERNAPQAIAFTGHRILTPEERAEADLRLYEFVSQAANLGTREFICGGALGFDTAAELAVLKLKREYPDVRLRLFLPCREHYKYWSQADAAVFEEILRLADSAEYANEKYFRGCMQMRDRAMVDASEMLAAWLRADEMTGGTVYTVRYALKHGVRVVNLIGDIENE